MIRQFADFELDTDARILRLSGRELPLQPRVFDLLVYLIEHRDRVVSKAELLETLWPGVIVTDASLQRAVCLARSALQQGDLEHAIHTYPRHGYRFSFDTTDTVPDSAAPPAATGDPASRLDEANDAFGQRRWGDARERYAAADLETALPPDALERWALAAQCLGHLADARVPLERAAASYSARGERDAAARALIALARIQLESMEPAIAGGCLRRAKSLLTGLPPSHAHGHLAWMSARFCLFEGDLDAALDYAKQAQTLGQALHDSDIETLGLLYRGISLQSLGQTRSGAELQDEAAAAVLSGDVSPLAGGIVYCGLVAGCCNRGDWRRAGQWTDSFGRWCERSHIDTFAGSCLLHRAEVFSACGELDRARQTIVDADALLRMGAPWALGDAARLLGDLHLMRGEFDEAERAYHEAHEQGWDPYPGYAILLHYRGRSSEAIRGLLRSSEYTVWAVAERKACYLAHAAWLAALSGDVALAGEIIDRLDEQPELWEEGAVVGQIDRARAEVAQTEGRTDDAIRLLRTAICVFQQKRAPLEAAIVQVRLAELLAHKRDLECAKLELSSAEALFRRAGALWPLQQCLQVRNGM